MKSIRYLLAVAFTLAVSLPLFAQTIKVNWEQNAPFSDYSTYAWRMSKHEGSHFYKQWVVADVDRTLQSKGMRKVALNQHPQVYLIYHEFTQEVADSTTMNDGFGWGGGPWGGFGGWGGWGMMGGMGTGMMTTQTEPRTMGILNVDIVDASKRKIVWRGQATVDAVSDTQKGDEKQVVKSVDKMFKNYPPRNSK